MCKVKFYSAYFLIAERERKKNFFLESFFLGCDSKDKNVDDLIKNEKELYEELFSTPCFTLVIQAFKLLNAVVENRKFDDVSDEIEALAILQQLVSIAIWKYRIPVGNALEEFAREFDRLDVEEERRRLFLKMQNSPVGYEV